MTEGRLQEIEDFINQNGIVSTKTARELVIELRRLQAREKELMVEVETIADHVAEWR